LNLKFSQASVFRIAAYSSFPNELGRGESEGQNLAT
jgi:hypothetical protein